MRTGETPAVVAPLIAIVTSVALVTALNRPGPARSTSAQWHPSHAPSATARQVRPPTASPPVPAPDPSAAGLAAAVAAGAAAPLTPGAGAAVARAANRAASYVVERRNPDGTALRWDPCGPMTIEVDPAGSPGIDAIQSAASELAAIARRPIDVVETTIATDRDVPDGVIAVAWHPLLDARPGRGQLGLTVPVFERDDRGRRWIVAAEISLAHDADISTDRHELGHAFGLGHTSDPTQLMFPVHRSVPSDYQAGDRAGLAVLASGPCRRG